MQISNNLNKRHIIVQYHNDRNTHHDTILLFNIDAARTYLQLKINHYDQTYFQTKISVKKFFKFTEKDLVNLIINIRHNQTDDSKESKIINHGISMIKVSIVEIQRIMYSYFKMHPLTK